MSDNLAKQLYWDSQNGPDQNIFELLQRGAPPNNSHYYTREQDGHTPLHWACANNHLRNAELLMKFGAIAATTNNYGSTPLHWACLHNNKDTAKLLLEHHCPTDIKDSSGQTAADVAREKGYSALADYVEGFQPRPRDPLSSYPTLEQLSQLKCDQWLQLGVRLGLGNDQLDTIKKSQHPTTETLQAAKLKNIDMQWKDIVEALMSIGEYKLAESVCSQQGEGESALSVSAFYGWLDCVKRLVETFGLDPKVAVNEAGDTPLSLAYKNRHLETIKYLAQKHQCDPKFAVNEAGDTPLSLECSRGNLEMVKALINKHVDPKKPVNKAGDTPLSLAYKGGHWEVVKYLAITHHCDTTSILLLAVKHEQDSTVEFLLEECRCDPNVTDKEGKTPLDLVNDPKIKKLLLKYRAKAEFHSDRNVTDKEGKTYSSQDHNTLREEHLISSTPTLDDKAGSDHVVPGIFPSPYKQADKPQPVKADKPSPERGRETEQKPSKEDELPNDVPKAFCELPSTTIKTRYSEESDATCARAQVATGKLWPINYGSPFNITTQPNDICCKPGEQAKLTILTSPPATTYQWYFKNQIISNPDYKGQTSERLLILKFLPKHKGVYWCVAEDASGTRTTSRHATLTAEGENIEKQELQFIGKMLEKSAIDFGNYGIEKGHLLNGSSDVTYEEMEFVMNLNLRTQVLSINLKQEVTSRLKEEQLYAKAIKKKISLTYTKIVALGPGQVGKSTFVSRLLGIMVGNIQTSPPETQPRSSTGISESREACIQYGRLTCAITNERKWHVLQDELHNQLSGLMSLIVKQSQQGPQHETSKNNSQRASKIETVESLVNDRGIQVTTDLSPGNEGTGIKSLLVTAGRHILKLLPVTIQEPIVTRQSALMPRESDIDKTIREFDELKHECSHRLETVEFEMLFNVADVGGQPAFLEMLPALTIGPALYLLFMNLKQDLSSRYSVPFKCKDSKTSLCKDYSYTSEEVLFSALSSIACFGHPDEQVEQYVQKPASGDKERKDSLALLVGTFFDEVKNKEEIELTNQQLNERLKGTAFYKEGLLHRKSFSLLVNNMSAEDSEIEAHRKKLETILTEKFRKYEIPTQWLMLSICLKLLARNQNKYHVSFADCVKLGKYLNMDEDMVSVALQFLHKYIGLVMYFPHHESLKKIVICDPQVVFSTISELIFNIYDHNKNQVSEAQYDRFVETGCFSPQDIMLTHVKEDKKKLLSITTVVDLLTHLNIAAKVPVSSSKGEVLYFLPAVLQTAETDAIKRKQKGGNDQLLPEPICIRFKTGYIPLGFVCALIANLTAEKKCDLLFDESNKLYKNMIQFRFQGMINLTVISLPRYCEFRVTRQLPDNDSIEFWSEDGCPLIMETVRTVANKVIQSLQHGLRSVNNDSEIYDFAFHAHCQRNSDTDFGQECLAKLDYNDSDKEIDVEKNIPEKVICTKCKTAIPLTPEMMVWFGKVPSTPLRICEQPARKGNVISIRADGVRPLTYEWLVGGIKLCDGDDHDYDGYATDSLIIKDSDLLSEVFFKCQVKDRFGNCVESNELDLFEDKLRRTWKLKKSEINKLKRNGFTSIRELKRLQLNTLDFNMGEKERIRPLLASLRVQWNIKQHPQDVLIKVGEDAKFFIAVTASSPGQVSYNWCFNNQSISDDNANYKGATTSELVVLKSLSKHCGSYKCIVTDQLLSDVQVPSFSAVLEIDGTKIEDEESKLLGIILQKVTSLQDGELDLNITELLSGTSNLTYEELQIVLDRTTQTSYLSTDLEQKLTTRIQEDKIYDEAIKNDKKIKLFCLKMLALGPGQIGKSTFIRRLLGIMEWDIDEDPENGPTRSTSLSEYREVFLRYSHESVALSTEQSWHVLDESDVGKELRALISLLNIQTEAETLSETVASEETKVTPQASLQQSDSPPSDLSDSKVIPTVNERESEKNSVALTNNTCPSSDTLKAQTKVQKSEIDEVYEEFEKLRSSTSSDSPDDDIKSIHALINIADVGGQPAFLELLPSLTIGPAMYLVFMKLLWELDTPQETRYKGENEMEALICKNYTYTPEEVIFTALSSIACFGHSDQEVEKYVYSDQDANSDVNKKKINSLALIMGTYADDLKSEDLAATKKVEDTNKRLRATLATTPFYKDGLIKYSSLCKKEVLFQINNKSGGKPEVDNYRKLIKNLIESKFRQYKIPARWLMFSICLKILAQKKKKSVIEFLDCVEVARRFGINDEKTVKVALRFLHKYIGLVMYFQKDEKLKLSKDIVICGPQAVFTSISDLIFNIYDPDVEPPVFDRFTQKGFFSPEDHSMEAIAAKKNQLPIEDLIPLLEYLNIAVPMVVDSINGYFLPAVLQTATSEVLNMSLDGADTVRDPEPLCVRFKTGFVPLGFVSALVANLLNNNNKDLLLLGNEQEEVVYKNKITFRFRGRYNIVLISRAKYCEFRVSRPLGAAKDEEFSKFCPLLKDMLQKSIKDVIDRMRQSSLFQPSHGYDFAFKCPQSNCKKTMGSGSSLLVINPEDQHLKSMTCESCKIAIDVTLQMKTWFTKDLAHDDISDDDQQDPRTTSLCELMVKYGVTDKQLNREITQEDLAPVAMHFDTVELYLNPLKLNGNEQVDVRTSGHVSSSNQVAVINCLSIWRGHKPSEATFRALIRILWDLRKEKIVTNICQYLEKKDHDTFGEEHLVQGEDLLPLDKVKKAVIAITADWYSLAIQLDIDYKARKVIECDHPSAAARFHAMLQDWVRRPSPPPSWSVLIRALKCPVISRADIAADIAADLEKHQDLGVSRDGESSIPSQGQQNVFVQKEPLSVDQHLKVVRETTWEARAKWKCLGEQLGVITMEKLEEIQYNHHNHHDVAGACLTGMLEHWLTQTDPPPSWSALIEALRSRALGQGDIANEIEIRIARDK
ncbi:uncharacterized protein LOC135336416 isoform X2 [Halichondria panicea]|uniref:uncharacterized protein LOC135336416 isoform X2 n=1 Tax=Halichondria panicea TaxID=6063 RepID=UPI00312BAEC7